MKKIAVVLALLLLLPAAAFAQVDPDTIYGNDDRDDLYKVEIPKVLELADATVALFSSKDVAVEGGKAVLTLQNYGEAMKLCPEERFREQSLGAFCSGALIAPDIIMTAGHCVTSEAACQATKFVFGFSIKDKGGKTPSVLPAAEVYGCKKLIDREQANEGADWALVRLDRPVPDHRPLKLNTGGEIAKGAPLFVIGHPTGLPTKVAGGAKVRDEAPKGYFVANLDTYGGNSGSAVFNGKTALVEGVLVRGENDYVWKGGCRVSNRCPDDGCRGEDVTRVSAVIARLPPPPGALQAVRLDLSAPSF